MSFKCKVEQQRVPSRRCKSRRSSSGCCCCCILIPQTELPPVAAQRAPRLSDCAHRTVLILFSSGHLVSQRVGKTRKSRISLSPPHTAHTPPFSSQREHETRRLSVSVSLLLRKHRVMHMENERERAPPHTHDWFHPKSPAKYSVLGFNHLPKEASHQCWAS